MIFISGGRAKRAKQLLGKVKRKIEELIDKN